MPVLVDSTRTTSPVEGSVRSASRQPMTDVGPRSALRSPMRPSAPGEESFSNVSCRVLARSTCGFGFPRRCSAALLKTSEARSSGSVVHCAIGFGCTSNCCASAAMSGRPSRGRWPPWSRRRLNGYGEDVACSLLLRATRPVRAGTSCSPEPEKPGFLQGCAVAYSRNAGAIPFARRQKKNAVTWTALDPTGGSNGGGGGN